MKMISLMEIPIYSMQENEFKKKWDKFINEGINNYVSHGWEEDEARKSLYKTYHPQHVWKYNQIIGYIIISGSRNDIWIDLFMPGGKRIYAKSTKKRFMFNQGLNGYHFYILSGDTSSTVFLKIKDMIEGVIKTCGKDRFVDTTTLLNIGPYIDWIKVLQDIKASELVSE